jgi:hypothetical protein
MLNSGLSSWSCAGPLRRIDINRFRRSCYPYRCKSRRAPESPAQNQRDKLDNQTSKPSLACFLCNYRVYLPSTDELIKSRKKSNIIKYQGHEEHEVEIIIYFLFLHVLHGEN